MLEHDGRGSDGIPFKDSPREFLDKVVDWDGRPYLRDYVVAIAFRVHDEIPKDATPPNNSMEWTRPAAA